MNRVVIESIIENNNFYVVIENVNIIKFKLPLSQMKSSRGAQYYDDTQVEQFIEKLKNNGDTSVELRDLKITLDMLHIQCIADDFMITLSNTEENREYLLVVLDKYVEYLWDATTSIGFP